MLGNVQDPFVIQMICGFQRFRVFNDLQLLDICRERMSQHNDIPTLNFLVLSDSDHQPKEPKKDSIHNLGMSRDVFELLGFSGGLSDVPSISENSLIFVYK